MRRWWRVLGGEQMVGLLLRLLPLGLKFVLHVVECKGRPRPGVLVVMLVQRRLIGEMCGACRRDGRGGSGGGRGRKEGLMVRLPVTGTKPTSEL